MQNLWKKRKAPSPVDWESTLSEEFVSNFNFITNPVVNSFSTGTDFKRQNLTSPY